MVKAEIEPRPASLKVDALTARPRRWFLSGHVYLCLLVLCGPVSRLTLTRPLRDGAECS